MSDPVVTKLHAAVMSYVMPQAAKDVITASHLLVLCGITAAGKNTLAEYLMTHADYEHVVSHTTRAPRENHGVMEQNGREYWFVTPSEMLAMVEAQKFIEVEAVHGDTCYGTSIEALQSVGRRGKRPVLEIDIKGGINLARAVAGLHPLFIIPPSFDVWMERLGGRGNLSDGEKNRRFQSAKAELQTAIDNKDFWLVINEEVAVTAQEILRGVDTTEAEQAKRRQTAQEILAFLQ